MKNLIFIILIVLPFSKVACSTISELEEIRDLICLRGGLGINSLPKLWISNDSFAVAAFNKKANIITIETKAIRVCESFGKNKTHALAFIISHELVHWLRSKGNSQFSNFLSYNYKKDMGNSSLEKDADIYGLFLCYIAGYNSLKFVPEILNSIYKDYGLINRKIYGYPTLQERIRSHESIEYSVNSLINLHKFSGYLISINELEYAYDCINYLTSIHKTKEVENNLGLLKLLTAIQTCHIESIDKFFFPIFLEDKSPFENKKMYRADTLFNSEFEKKLQLRNKLLKQAIHYFDLALARDKNYESAHINKNIAIILQGDLIESISYISELSNYTKFNNNNSLKLLNTISLFLVGKIDSITAKNELYLLLNNAKNRLDSSLILANIQQFEKQKPKYKPSLQLPIDCEISLGMLQPNISGTRNKLIINKKNQLAFIWSKQGAGITYAFEKNGNRIITIKNYPLPEHDPILLDAEIASNPDKFMNLLYTPNGFIIHNPIEQYLVKCTTNGVVKDLLKYFK